MRPDAEEPLFLIPGWQQIKQRRPSLFGGGCPATGVNVSSGAPFLHDQWHVCQLGRCGRSVELRHQLMPSDLAARTDVQELPSQLNPLQGPAVVQPHLGVAMQVEREEASGVAD